MFRYLIIQHTTLKGYGSYQPECKEPPITLDDLFEVLENLECDNTTGFEIIQLEDRENGGGYNGRDISAEIEEAVARRFRDYGDEGAYPYDRWFEPAFVSLFGEPIPEPSDYDRRAA